ncbi:hypothetical protein ElyMa_005190700 [Elysia marginata]|uniref:Uncharacterized protein n=1 Tax=Elysia marginata TaxID=1093978 RepID=A0AAV4JYQ7_9GAST|nr:hypothetical protein ElyMa_005190700 [Elysia marginata]
MCSKSIHFDCTICSISRHTTDALVPAREKEDGRTGTREGRRSYRHARRKTVVPAREKQDVCAGVILLGFRSVPLEILGCAVLEAQSLTGHLNV